MTSSRYTYIWEYEVRPDADADFRKHYSPGGSWVALFRRADGYVETQLFRDQEKHNRYITIDTWESDAAHAAFRKRFASEFATLDQLCERFTIRETNLGHFELVDTHEGTV